MRWQKPKSIFLRPIYPPLSTRTSRLYCSSPSSSLSLTLSHLDLVASAPGIFLLLFFFLFFYYFLLSTNYYYNQTTASGTCTENEELRQRTHTTTTIGNEKNDDEQLPHLQHHQEHQLERGLDSLDWRHKVLSKFLLSFSSFTNYCCSQTLHVASTIITPGYKGPRYMYANLI